MLVAGGCGGGGADPAPTRQPATEIAIAISGEVGRDPLSARDRSTQFVLRQVYEPLAGNADPPFGRTGDPRGLSLGFRPNRDATVWTVRLRRGVEFSDGASFNGSAVAVNARRWAEEAPGLVPELVAADAPRADRVRLILARPDRDLPDRLSDPRLGIVSPQALAPRRNRSFAFRAGKAVGTGAFVVAHQSRGGVMVDRNNGWWGSELGLGPALSTIVYSVEPDAQQRLTQLEAGQVEIADGLGGLPRRTLQGPLYVSIRAPGSVMAVERSLRGVESGLPGTPLSGAWLTTVNQPLPVG